MFGLVNVAIQSSICVWKGEGVYLQFYFFFFLVLFHFKTQQTKPNLFLPSPSRSCLVLRARHTTVAAPALLLPSRPTAGLTSHYSTLLGQTSKDNKQKHQLRTRHINNSAQNTFLPGSKSRRSSMQVYVRVVKRAGLAFWQHRAQQERNQRRDRWGELDKRHKTQSWHVGRRAQEWFWLRLRSSVTFAVW